MPFIIVRDDLTKMHVDAVVNTANIKLQQGNGGVSGAIFKAAGADALRAACEEIGGCSLGNSVVTPGFNLPAAYIIHTPGMAWIDGSHNEEAVLRSCYRSCLRLAAGEGYESIAFPLIGSGGHDYPKPLAFNIATQEINNFLLSYEGDMIVYLAVFGHQVFDLSKKLTDEVREFIDDNYVDARPDHVRSRTTRVEYLKSMMAVDEKDSELCMSALPESEIKAGISFAQAMTNYIDSHEMKDPEVYFRANITKQNYNKIKLGKSQPKKTTALALCVAMRLPLEETIHFLALAGYALSSSRSDKIVQYFISRGIYNVTEINGVLFDYHEDKFLLGSAEK